MKQTKFFRFLTLTIMALSAISCRMPDFLNFLNPQKGSSSGEYVEPEIMADCFIYINLSAWIDENGDGIWISTEEPLSDVSFHIDGGFASMLSAYPCISNGDGQCTMRLWTPGICEDKDYTITANPPEYFEPTIPNTITFHLTATEDSYDAQFGFQVGETNK